MKHNSRPDILIGATLITVSLVAQQLTHLPLWVFIAFLLSGVYLWGEAARTHHVFQSALCFERTLQAQAKAPKQQTITQEVPKAMRHMVFDWMDGKDTTKRHALSLGVTEAQWQAAVRWAVGNRFGELVPAEGGARKLRWTAESINDVLPVMAQLVALS